MLLMRVTTFAETDRRGNDFHTAASENYALLRTQCVRLCFTDGSNNFRTQPTGSEIRSRVRRNQRVEVSFIKLAMCLPDKT